MLAVHAWGESRNEANILASLDTFMLMLFSFLQLIDKHKGGMGG